VWGFFSSTSSKLAKVFRRHVLTSGHTDPIISLKNSPVSIYLSDELDQLDQTHGTTLTMTNHDTTPDNLLAGAIDAHVHGAPDTYERRMNVVELAHDAAEERMDGLVLLNHWSDTTPQAAIVNEVVEGTNVRGGIKLNRPVGGLNPDAVEIVVGLGAAKVDMPTQHAANELQAKGESPERGLTVLEDDQLRPEMHEILDIVADSQATVATGHLSPEEVVAVAEAAIDHGIEHPIVSHPTLPSIDLPVETQVSLASDGAMIEYCYVNTTTILASHYDGWTPLAPAELLEQAAEVGPESVILATDFGQPDNPAPTSGLREFIADALEFEFNEREIEQMIQDNPRKAYNF